MSSLLGQQKHTLILQQFLCSSKSEKGNLGQNINQLLPPISRRKVEGYLPLYQAFCRCHKVKTTKLLPINSIWFNFVDWLISTKLQEKYSQGTLHSKVRTSPTEVPQAPPPISDTFLSTTLVSIVHSPIRLHTLPISSVQMRPSHRDNDICPVFQQRG